MTNTRVLVLGATGYIGQQIVAALSATDWATPLSAARRGAQITVDATHAAALAQASEHVDVIVNALSGSDQAIIANANALRFTLEQHPHLRVIHFSSMAAYGSVQGLVDESCPLLGDLGPYSQAKAKAEQILRDHESRIVTLRPGCVYGHGSPQWSTRIAQLLRAHRLGDLGAIGDGCSNLVHVDDVVQAVLTAIQSPSTYGQAYNLAIPNAPTWNEYFMAYAHALSATPITRIGARRLKCETKLVAPLFKLTEIACRKLKLNTSWIPATITPSLLQLWNQDIELASHKATQELAMSWAPWKQAMLS
jgi:nucleoside-diphosphate-sugar epimerase